MACALQHGEAKSTGPGWRRHTRVLRQDQQPETEHEFIGGHTAPAAEFEVLRPSARSGPVATKTGPHPTADDEEGETDWRLARG